jgi:hypothetical protein
VCQYTGGGCSRAPTSCSRRGRCTTSIQLTHSLKRLVTQPLNLKCDLLVSKISFPGFKLAFKFNLCRYVPGHREGVAAVAVSTDLGGGCTR